MNASRVDSGQRTRQCLCEIEIGGTAGDDQRLSPGRCVKRLAATFTLAAAFVAPARAAPAVVSDLQPIALQSGVNRIPHLALDGHDGMIVLGWRENGNAHSYDVALVLLSAGPNGPWNVARVELPDKDPWADRQDGVRDDPHTGEDVVRTFRFARGRIDGQAATLLLIATRDPGDTIPSPSTVTFQTSRLVHDPDVGTTPDHFGLFSQDRSSLPFCNAEMTFSKRFGLALRASYIGPQTVEGCQ